jgi:Cu(I)-responsive transcriptional regulator
MPRPCGLSCWRARRRDNGYRDYAIEDVHRLRFLQRSRSLGFSVEECRQLLSLYVDCERESAEVKAIAATKLGEIERKIEELQGLRDMLKHLVANCHGDDRPVCPIIDNLAGGWPTLKAALQFLTLTCVRPGEVRGAARDEFDRNKTVWHIPAERMKMRAPHDVPLSKQVLRVLEEVWPLSEHGGLLFPSIRSTKRPLSENAMNAALRRMGYSKDAVTAHGFRLTASTILNARNYDPNVIEAVLAHQDKNAIRRTYNRATY